MVKLNLIEDTTEDSLREAQDSYKTAKNVLEKVNQIVTEIKDDLKEEREGSPIDVNKIKAELRKKRHEKDQIKRKIEKLKQRSRNHKDAISQWKQWYETINEEDKTEEREKLMSEINRRAAEIKTIEEEIGKSFPIEKKISEEIDILELKEQIFRQDVSITADQRLSDLLIQQKKAENLLESARQDLENIKKKTEEMVK